MPSPFDAMLAGADATIFATFGVTASWQPEYGTAWPAMVIIDRPTENDIFGPGRLPVSIDRCRLQVRRSEVATPLAGDLVTADGETFTVLGEPSLDAAMAIWQCEATQSA